MGRPKLNQSRDKKYYGVPTRIKPQIVAKITKLYPGVGALNHKLLQMVKEIEAKRFNKTYDATYGFAGKVDGTDGLVKIVTGDTNKVKEMTKKYAKKGNRNKDNKVGSTTTR